MIILEIRKGKMQEKHIWKYNISKNEAGKKVKEILKEQMHLSKRRVAALKKSPTGIQIEEKLEGKKQIRCVTVREVLKQGQNLLIELENQETNVDSICPKQMNLDILYEDNDLLILNKPAGVVIHPSLGHLEDSLCNGVAWYLKEKKEKTNICVIGRLDKDTSGIVTIAKNSITADIFSKFRSNGLCKKEYIAFVHGQLENVEGSIEIPMKESRLEDGRLKMTKAKMEDGKAATTIYKVEKIGTYWTKVRVWIKTGRTHQIRFHFSEIGHPLLGDLLYGEKKEDTINRAALHADSLVFEHPFTRKKIKVMAHLPNDLLELEAGKEKVDRKTSSEKEEELKEIQD